MGHFGFPKSHLQHAVASNLPCYYIKLLGNESQDAQTQPPSIMNMAKWIRQAIYQHSSSMMEEFSLFIPAGKNRYKFGVTSKNDFLKLWNCHWPDMMNQHMVEIERPRSLPDCCALVVRHVPEKIPKEFVYQEINKSIKSAVSFSKINYRQRATNDYRFCVTDEGEYEEIVNIGRTTVGHLLLSVTPFVPGLNMTYCNKCWQLGHTRSQCKNEPKCRKCLEIWQYKHQCTKPTICAQCGGSHSSLSGECVVLQNCRRALKGEVGIATSTGILSQKDRNEKPKHLRQLPNDYPILKQRDTGRPAWAIQLSNPNEGQLQKEKEETKQLTVQVNCILEVTQRLETKLDNQDSKLKRLGEMSMVSKQHVTTLAGILQQIIDAMMEKAGKNKQHNLNQLAQQIQKFRKNIADYYKEQEHVSEENLTASKEKNGQEEQEQLMESREDE